jgi:hypothetical protein
MQPGAVAWHIPADEKAGQARQLPCEQHICPQPAAAIQAGLSRLLT